MNDKLSFVRFFFINFPLQIVFLILFIPLLFLSCFFSLDLLLLLVLVSIFIIGVLRLSYLLFIRANHPFQRFLVLDLTHTLLFAPIFFILIASVGGMSMAVVDGEAGNAFDRYIQYALYTIFSLALCQVLIIPWSLFCDYLTNKIENIKTSKVVFFCLLGIVSAYLFFISVPRILFMRSFKPDAKHIYQNYFSTPIEKIQKLHSGGMAWLDNPVFIKFESKDTITLKEQNLYSPADITEPRRLLLMKYPADKTILDDTGNLICVSYSEKKDVQTRTSWLLYNTKTGHYYLFIQ